MPYRITPLVNENFYHIYNRGVEKRTIFLEDRDYQRFLQTLYYYQFAGPKPAFSEYDRYKEKDFSNNYKIVEVTCFCLMPNHFHILIKQLENNGISEFMRKVANSYTKYFNTKSRRVGPLLQGMFKAVLIENDSQFIHVSRYIHLNPYVSDLVKNVGSYQYSSYPYFIGTASSRLCVSDPILSQFKDSEDYRKFVEEYADFARELEYMKHILIEED